MSLPICCTQDIRQQYPTAVNIEVLLPGQRSRSQRRQQNVGGLQPGGQAGRFCRDLAVPGRPSDCPANAHRCSEPLWISVMAQQCLGTCTELCKQLLGGTRVGNIPFTGIGRQPARQPGGLWQPRSSRIGDRRLGGGRGEKNFFNWERFFLILGCRDWIFPAGRMDCISMVAMGFCLSDRTRMLAQCPARCNFC